MFDLDMADIRMSVLNLFLFALLALITIPPLKYALTKFQVPGLSPLAAAI